MDQYHPAGKVAGGRYEEIGRRPTSAELEEVRAIAAELGLRRLDERRPHPRLLRRMV
jgi:putative pyruvate formate lyase activating enzyme